MWTRGAVLFLKEEEFIILINSLGIWKIHISFGIIITYLYQKSVVWKNKQKKPLHKILTPQKPKNLNQTYISKFPDVINTCQRTCLITDNFHHLASKHTYFRLSFQKFPFKAFIKHELYSRIEDQQQGGKCTIP